MTPKDAINLIMLALALAVGVGMALSVLPMLGVMALAKWLGLS